MCHFNLKILPNTIYGQGLRQTRLGLSLQRSSHFIGVGCKGIEKGRGRGEKGRSRKEGARERDEKGQQRVGQGRKGTEKRKSESEVILPLLHCVLLTSSLHRC